MSVKYPNKHFFRENEQIHTFFCSANRKGCMHFHEFWELSYMYEGQGENHTLSNKETVESDEFLLIRPGTVHSLVSRLKQESESARLCNCLFTHEYFNMVFKRYSEIPGIKEYEFYKLIISKKPFCLHLSDDNTYNIKHIIWLIAHEYAHFTTGSETVIMQSMINLLVSISRLYEKQVNNGTDFDSKDDVINEIKHYLKTNFGYRITLEDISMRVHLSREYISRYFKRCTGKTVSQYLTEIRIENAKRKLATTNYSVAEIAEYCGYPSIGNFQQAFKKITGLSPGEYRKRNSVYR